MKESLTGEFEYFTKTPILYLIDKQFKISGEGCRMPTIGSISGQLKAIHEEISRKVVGQSKVIRHAIAALAASGHVLLEDVPGTGKTTLAAAIASVLGLRFHRVQGTPDLLPSELVGTMVFNPATAEFRFRQGPIFTQVLLMDEINRSTPRTQSALLEAMSEAQVSHDGDTHALQPPFFVIATANPIESQGIFPLPEAQLDRFLVRLKLGYTDEDDELEMVKRIQLEQATELKTLVSQAQVMEIRQHVRGVKVHNDVLRYIVRLCRATRSHDEILLGASPRSVIALTSFAQALATISNRDFVTPDDVQEAWLPVMNHRIRTKIEWQVDEHDEASSLLQHILTTVAAPTEFVREA